MSDTRIRGGPIGTRHRCQALAETLKFWTTKKFRRLGYFYAQTPVTGGKTKLYNAREDELRSELGRVDNVLEVLENKRGLTSEEETRLHQLSMKRIHIRGKLDDERQFAAEGGYLPAVTPRIEGQRNESTDEREYREAWNLYMRRGINAIGYAEQDVLNKGRKELSADEMRVVAPMGTGAAGGGYLVPSSMASAILEKQKSYVGIWRAGVATELETNGGETMHVPVNDDTSNSAVILAENTDAGDGAPLTMSEFTLGAYTYNVAPIRVSFQLLQDEAFDLNKFIPAAIGRRLGRGQAAHIANGNGTSQPQGVVTSLAVGNEVLGTTGSTTTCTYDNLVDVQGKLDVAYWQDSQWLMSPQAFTMLRKVKDSQQRPVIVDPMGGMPATILGFPVILDAQIPIPAASAKSIIFGDYSTFYVRHVKNPIVLRLTERYAEFGQVGFIAFDRLDSKAGMATSYAYFKHSAT
jgi:HK97 family phage major capsid protein